MKVNARVTPRPCDQCPFTRYPKAVRLTRARAREIARNATSSDGGSFPCHKTTLGEESDDGRYQRTGHELDCAGSIIFGDKHGVANQYVRVIERIGVLDIAALKGRDTVFDSEREMVATALDRRRR